MSANDIPCRVSAELRQHQADQDRADKIIPYFGDTEDYEGIVRKEIAEPLAQLFVTRDAILIAQRIEGLNKDRAIEWFLRDMAELERVLRQEWENA